MTLIFNKLLDTVKINVHERKKHVFKKKMAKKAVCTRPGVSGIKYTRWGIALPQTP